MKLTMDGRLEMDERYTTDEGMYFINSLSNTINGLMKENVLLDKNECDIIMDIIINLDQGWAVDLSKEIEVKVVPVNKCSCNFVFRNRFFNKEECCMSMGIGGVRLTSIIKKIISVRFDR